MNISKYAPLFGNSFIELPNKLRYPKKSLINIKNRDKKCFLWCHVRHLNPIDKNSERINKKDKELANILDCSGITFPIFKKQICKIEKQNSICINAFVYDNGVIYPIDVSNEKFNNSMDLLLIFQENTFHHVYIKDFNTLMFNKSKNKNKMYFCRYCLQCFGSGSILTEHKKI